MGQTCLARSSRNKQISLISLLFVALLQLTSGRELKYVLLLYRHGDRSPLKNYHNGLHNESDWSQGFGQLTTLGMQQQFEVGQYMKKRYTGFLSATYKQEEVLIKSTELDRTIMSAQSKLAGLFPPAGDQIWNPEILWQPIPVHVVPKAYSPKLRFPMFGCKRYLQLLKETMNSTEFQSKIQPYEDSFVVVASVPCKRHFKEFLKEIAGYAGYEFDTFKCLDTFQVWTVQDTLFCESVHNFTLPVWATEDVRAKLSELAALTLSSFFGIYKNVEKARLQGGLLVNSIIETLSNAAQYPGKRKLLAYSVHDTTIGALQMALNIHNGKLLPYASCQFFELYKEDNGEHTIEMHFRNDTSEEPYQLSLPGCSPACPLSKFAELVHPINTYSWEMECENVGREEKRTLTANGRLLCLQQKHESHGK